MDSVTWPERTLLPQYCYLASDVPPSSSIFLPQKTLPPPCCYLRELSFIHELPCFSELSLLHVVTRPQNFSLLHVVTWFRHFSLLLQFAASENSHPTMLLPQRTLPHQCVTLLSELSLLHVVTWPQRTLPHTCYLRELSLIHFS